MVAERNHSETISKSQTVGSRLRLSLIKTCCVFSFQSFCFMSKKWWNDTGKEEELPVWWIRSISILPSSWSRSSHYSIPPSGHLSNWETKGHGCWRQLRRIRGEEEGEEGETWLDFLVSLFSAENSTDCGSPLSTCGPARPQQWLQNLCLLNLSSRLF